MNKSQKNEQVSLFFPMLPSGPAAGTSLLLTSKVLLFILRPLGILSWRPCPRVRPRRHATQRARSEIFKLSLGDSADFSSSTQSFAPKPFASDPLKSPSQCHL